jgi:hypothetical protein
MVSAHQTMLTRTLRTTRDRSLFDAFYRCNAVRDNDYAVNKNDDAVEIMPK